MTHLNSEDEPCVSRHNRDGHLEDVANVACPLNKQQWEKMEGLVHRKWTLTKFDPYELYVTLFTEWRWPAWPFLACSFQGKDSFMVTGYSIGLLRARSFKKKKKKSCPSLPRTMGKKHEISSEGKAELIRCLIRRCQMPAHNTIPHTAPRCIATWRHHIEREINWWERGRGKRDVAREHRRKSGSRCEGKLIEEQGSWQNWSVDSVLLLQPANTREAKCNKQTRWEVITQRLCPSNAEKRENLDVCVTILPRWFKLV